MPTEKEEKEQETQVEPYDQLQRRAATERRKHLDIRTSSFMEKYRELCQSHGMHFIAKPKIVDPGLIAGELVLVDDLN